MPEKSKKQPEEAVEKTGKVVGKGLKKGFRAVKGFGEGLKEGVKTQEKKKD